ncbi:MAG: MBL fold metallo-hydrolase [Candidatus Aerophobetes bacterium]|nr:MBL fold metallo-hydrolase [Candidatus Aerophobetes bacterium]
MKKVFLRILILNLISLFLISGGIMSKENAHPVTITIVYDNNRYNTALETRWGFSCLIKGLEKTILFDTGGEGDILLSNMEKLNIDPQKIEVVILSHIHYDHVGGLFALLEKNHNLAVYLPESFPENFKNKVKKYGAKVVEVDNFVGICQNVYSTGQLGTWIKEESLIIKIDKGLIVITGCAHPGIVHIVKKTKEKLDAPIYLIMGGFHLSGTSKKKTDKIVNEFKKKGVERVAPCHCSGDLAREEFKRAYGNNFIPAGVGKKIEIPFKK